MRLRRVRLLGDSALRQRAHKVTRFNDNLAAVIDDMTETMRSSNGVGLAAPQVGLLKRVIVVETPEDQDEPGSGRLYAIANPEIVRASKDQVDGIEGCLSIPGYVGEVTRHKAVTVQGQDLRGRKFRIKAQGFLARALQHEIDHLEGILFIDQLVAPDRIWSVQEGQEEQSEVPGATVELAPADIHKKIPV